MSHIITKKLADTDLDDFIKVIQIFEHVFEMEDFTAPATNHLETLLNKNDFIVFAAFVDNKIVGGLTAYVLDQYYSEKPLAYIYDLAVITPYQRRGIGTSLIADMNQYCKEKGFEEVFVQADKVDEYALEFYRSTQPTEAEQVVHFYYTLDENN